MSDSEDRTRAEPLTSSEIKALCAEADRLLESHAALCDEDGAAHCLCNVAEQYRAAQERFWAARETRKKWLKTIDRGDPASIRLTARREVAQEIADWLEPRLVDVPSTEILRHATKRIREKYGLGAAEETK